MINGDTADVFHYGKYDCPVNVFYCPSVLDTWARKAHRHANHIRYTGTTERHAGAQDIVYQTVTYSNKTQLKLTGGRNRHSSFYGHRQMLIASTPIEDKNTNHKISSDIT